MPRVKAIKMLRSVDKNENTNVTFNQTTPSAHNHNNSDNNGQGTKQIPFASYEIVQ